MVNLWRRLRSFRRPMTSFDQLEKQGFIILHEVHEEDLGKAVNRVLGEINSVEERLFSGDAGEYEIFIHQSSKGGEKRSFYVSYRTSKYFYGYFNK